MLKKVCMSVAVLLLSAGIAFAGNVDLSVSIGRPAPQVKVVEKQTIIVKEKKDHGKHRGHDKEKGHKRKHKD